MFVARVPNVRAVQPIGISEHRGGLVERDMMLGQVGGGLALVPFEHSFKYIHKRSALRFPSLTEEDVRAAIAVAAASAQEDLPGTCRFPRLGSDGSEDTRE